MKKISVIMIDGGFRENTYGAKYFAEQYFPEDQYEVIWVEYYDRINAEVTRNPKVKTIALQKSDCYHSSLCFNRGIMEAQGEVVVIPDADQIVRPDFLAKVWEIHSQYENLVAYGYRYDEVRSGTLKSFEFRELEDKCKLKNPLNYGGCLTVRKKWLIKVNGYEQHPIFRTGNHANGLDMYTRFKNLGLAVEWDPSLKLYHPWHPYTLQYTREHRIQKKLIEWRHANLQWEAFMGIDPAKNYEAPGDARDLLEHELKMLDRGPLVDILPILNQLLSIFKKTIRELIMVLGKRMTAK